MSLERRGVYSPSVGINLSGRDSAHVILYMSDSTRVIGTLLLPAGAGLAELLNLQGGEFVSMTDAHVASDGDTRSFASLVVNKRHIVSGSELLEGMTNP